jgi:argininosuccinate synthase
MNRILLGHSGSADSTRAIASLADRYAAEVVTLTLDLGQGGRLEDVYERALGAGAVRAHVIDAREEFARSFVFPALRGAACAGLGVPEFRTLGHAIVAKHLCAMAEIEAPRVIAYGGWHDGAHHPLTPLLRSLPSSIQRLPLPCPGTGPRPVEANLLGRLVEAQPADGSFEECFVLTRAVAGAPEIGADVELGFERGIPVAINGVEMSPVELIQSLQTIAGAHGIGRAIMQLDPGDITSQVLQDAPAAMALHAAYRGLRERENGVVHIALLRGECRVAGSVPLEPQGAFSR